MQTEFKVGDRVVVGPDGLMNVKAAAGKTATVERSRGTVFSLKFDEAIRSDSGFPHTTWFASAHMIALAPVAEVPAPPAAYGNYDDFRLVINTNGSGSESCSDGSISLRRRREWENGLDLSVSYAHSLGDARCGTIDDAAAIALRDALTRLYPIVPAAQVQSVADAREFKAGDRVVVGARGLLNVRAAAGKRATVADGWFLQLDERVPNDGGLKDTRWAFYPSEVTLASDPRADVYAAIDSERDYQEENKQTLVDGGNKAYSVGEFLFCMEEYLAKARAEWVKPFGVPASLDNLRKVAALAVNCMELHGAPKRT